MNTDVSGFCLRKPPAVHVLLQLLFAPRVDSIEGLLEPVAEDMAKVGFPFHGQGVIDVVTNRPGQFLVHKRPVVIFMDRDQTFQFVFADDGIVVQTSAYTDFVAFWHRIETVLPQVLDRLGSKTLRRVGLRYVNHVRPVVDKGFQDYLVPQLLGFARKDQDATNHFWRIENFYPSTGGGASVRCSRLPDIPPLPPGIEPLGLLYPQTDVEKPDTSIAVLDIDCYSRLELPFSLDSVRQQVSPLNTDATCLFMQSITTYARNEWEEKQEDKP